MLSVCVTSMNINNSYAAAEPMSTRLFTPTSSALHTSVVAGYYVILRAIARHGRQQESLPSVIEASCCPNSPLAAVVVALSEIRRALWPSGRQERTIDYMIGAGPPVGLPKSKVN